MRTAIYSVAAILSLAVLSGCDREDQTKPQPQAAPSPVTEPQATTPPATPTAEPSMTDRLNQGMQQGQQSAADALQQGQEAAGTAAQQAGDATLTTEASTKINQAIQYVKENKLDLAEKTLSQVEQQKDKLPPALQTRLADARQLLDSAKSGAPQQP